MPIHVPELERIPADQRQSVLEEAVRTVNATHGKMPNTAHYVGCAAAAAIVLPLAIMGKGMLVAVPAGMLGYASSLAIGFVLWRRSMVRELRSVVSRILAAQSGA
jgi:hypothetical protein